MNKIIISKKIAELNNWLLSMLMNGQATVRRPKEFRDKVGEVKEYVSRDHGKLRMVAEEKGKYKN